MPDVHHPRPRRLDLVALLLLLVPCSTSEAAARLEHSHVARRMDYRQLFQQAMRRRDLGNWPDALILFDRALKQKDVEGERVKFYGRRRFPMYLPQFYVAEALFHLGDYSQALKIWEDYRPGGRKATLLPRRERQLMGRYRDEYETRLFPAEVGTLAGHMFTTRAALRSIETATKEFTGDRWQQLEPRLRRPPEPCVSEETSPPKRLGQLWSCLDRAEALLASAQGDQKDYGKVKEARGMVEAVVFTVVQWQRAIRPDAKGPAGATAARRLEEPPISDGQFPTRWTRGGVGGARSPLLHRAGTYSSAQGPRSMAAVGHLRDAVSDAEPTVASGCDGPKREIPEPHYGERHALLIGISEYEHWNTLPGVQRDVPAIKNALCALGYDTVQVLPPEDQRTQDTLEKAISGFLKQAGKKPDNQVLLYYAGHGQTVLRKGQEIGFMVPADAAAFDRSADDAFVDSAVSMGTITAAIEKMKARHFVFVLDSCFAGVIFDRLSPAVAVIDRPSPEEGEGAGSRGIGVVEEPPSSPSSRRYKAIETLLKNPVQWFLTAGKADQKVPDDSSFAAALVEGLKGEAHAYYPNILTGVELSSFVQYRVGEVRGDRQTPLYGPLGLPLRTGSGQVLFHRPQ